MSWTLHVGDCLDIMRGMADASVDAVVCDPPYGLGFMGKAWDALPPGVEWARECLRVTKPGGHLLAFGGTRTSHRLACALEDAGWEIRDVVHWCYWSGFPKSLDVSKALDRQAGVEREVVGSKLGLPGYTHTVNSTGAVFSHAGRGEAACAITAPATPEARRWSGWGTALKPAIEIAVLANKPHDLASLCGTLALEVKEATCRLRSHASAAATPFTSSPSAFAADGFGSAQWSAVERCSTPGDLYALTDTWLSEGRAMPTTLSIAWSWLDTLAAASEQASRSTTSTESAAITVLRTFVSCGLRITPASIIEAATPGVGIGSSAFRAVSTFNVARSILATTRTPSVPGSATAPVDERGLSPSIEPAILARKPLTESSIARQVLATGTGALHVDGCRFAPGDGMWVGPGSAEQYEAKHASVIGCKVGFTGECYGDMERIATESAAHPLGRWPANLVHVPKASRAERERGCSGLPPVTRAEAVDREAGSAGASHPRAGAGRERRSTSYGGMNARECRVCGSRSRWAGRWPNCEHDDWAWVEQHEEAHKARAGEDGRTIRNGHPTVKPARLMRWLSRLVTPPGGTILDPFAGSGTEGVAAVLEGFAYIGCELSDEYAAIARARISHAEQYPDLWEDTRPGCDPAEERKKGDGPSREELETAGQEVLWDC